jgi:uncharacterized protein YecE (DUF72 family)
VRILTGTSGWSYPAWRGRFYPPDLAAPRFLAFYASRLETVEVAGTFYRMPRAAPLAAWRAQVPPGFVFALKAPQRITHEKALAGADGDVRHLLAAAAALGAGLGPIRFLVPPTLKRDVARLRDFLAQLPADGRFAFDFRHESWQAEDVHATLADAGAALCIAETEEASTPLVATATFGYVRLRRLDYDAAALARWMDVIRAQPWADAFVFFRHEDEARGPAYALRAREILDGRPAAVPLAAARRP